MFKEVDTLTLTPEQERLAEIERLKERIQANNGTLQDQQRLLWLQSMRPFELTSSIAGRGRE